MWRKRDWEQFFQMASQPRMRLRPPRPIQRIDAERMGPAVGFSLGELSAAGVSIDWAEAFGLPVDAGRVGSDEINVSALRDFARTARSGN